MALAMHCNLMLTKVAPVVQSFWALITRPVMNRPTNSILQHTGTHSVPVCCKIRLKIQHSLTLYG